MRSKNEQTLNSILKLINYCYFESGTYPTFQQIAAEVGLSVPQTYRYVDELIKRGDLEKNGRYGDLQTKEIVNSLCSHNRLPIVGVSLRFLVNSWVAENSLFFVRKAKV